MSGFIHSNNWLEHFNTSDRIIPVPSYYYPNIMIISVPDQKQNRHENKRFITILIPVFAFTFHQL